MIQAAPKTRHSALMCRARGEEEGEGRGSRRKSRDTLLISPGLRAVFPALPGEMNIMSPDLVGHPVTAMPCPAVALIAAMAVAAAGPHGASAQAEYPAHWWAAVSKEDAPSRRRIVLLSRRRSMEGDVGVHTACPAEEESILPWDPKLGKVVNFIHLVKDHVRFSRRI